MNEACTQIINDVRTVLNENHAVKDRIEKLLQYHYNVIYVRKNKCWEYTGGVQKLVYLNPYQDCGTDYIGMSPYDTAQVPPPKKTEHSLFIQISGFEGRFKDVKFSYCTYYVVIPDNQYSQYVRKIKLRKVSENSE